MNVRSWQPSANYDEPDYYPRGGIITEIDIQGDE